MKNQETVGNRRFSNKEPHLPFSCRLRRRAKIFGNLGIFEKTPIDESLNPPGGTRNGCQPLHAYRSPVRCANPPSAEKRLMSGVRVLGFSVDCVWSVLVTTFDCFRLLVSPRSSGEISHSLQSGILDVDAVCSTTSFSAAQGGSFRLTSARPRHEPTQGNFSVADFRSSM